MPYFSTSAMPFPTATLAGIETAYMIRKGQFAGKGKSAVQQFKALEG
jgi:putative transposase